MASSRKGQQLSSSNTPQFAARLPTSNAGRPLLDCTALRQALVEKGFALQQEHDVCELLQTVLECVGAAQPPAASALQGSCGKLIDAQFGTLSTKKVLSRQNHYGRQQPHPACSRWEHLQKVNGNDLMSIAAASAHAAGMGELLRAQLGCRDEFGFPIADAEERCCVAAPQALVLQLQLEYQVSRDEIWRVMQGIQPAIDIASWFAAGCAPASCKYRLSSVVVFYSGHFKTFCVDHVLGSWLLLDDAMIRMLDSWQAVVNMCVEGISRPYLLVYQAVDN